MQTAGDGDEEGCVGEGVVRSGFVNVGVVVRRAGFGSLLQHRRQVKRPEERIVAEKSTFVCRGRGLSVWRVSGSIVGAVGALRCG